MFLWCLPLSNEQEARQSRFRGQQIVAGGVALAFAYIEANGQQTARLVVEEFEVHRRQSAAPSDQIVNDP